MRWNGLSVFVMHTQVLCEGHLLLPLPTDILTCTSTSKERPALKRWILPRGRISLFHRLVYVSASALHWSREHYLPRLSAAPFISASALRWGHRESSSPLSPLCRADLWAPLPFNVCVFISLLKVSFVFIRLRELSVSSSPPVHFLFYFIFLSCFVCLHWASRLLSHRDFAYVARDKNTRILKCHVFRCDTPAKAIATSLHEICSRVRTWGRRTYSDGYQYARGNSARVGIFCEG